MENVEREDSTGHSSPNQALEPTPYSVRCAPASGAAHRGRSVSETQRFLTVYTYPCTVNP